MTLDRVVRAASVAAPPLRVLLACEWFIKYTAGLARGLAENRCDVVLLTRAHDLEFGGKPGAMRAFVRETLEGAGTHHELGGRVRDVSRLGELARLGRALSLWNPQVVHVQDSLPNDLRLAALAGLARRRFALTVHDPVPHPGDPRPPARIRVTRRTLRRRASLVFVHSTALAEELRATGEVRGPIEVVPHGAGAVAATAMPDHPSFLFFGRISHYKGLDTLLDAMPHVWARLPDVKLTVAGEGPTPRHATLADPRVILRSGYVPEHDLSQLFDQATCIVLPYRQASQSGVGSEAKRHGKGTIATDVGGLPELIAPGSGLLVPPEDPAALADAIVRVASSPELATEMGRKAAESVQDLRWSRVAEKTIQAYRQHLL